MRKFIVIIMIVLIGLGTVKHASFAEEALNISNETLNNVKKKIGFIL